MKRPAKLTAGGKGQGSGSKLVSSLKKGLSSFVLGKPVAPVPTKPDGKAKTATGALPGRTEKAASAAKMPLPKAQGKKSADAHSGANGARLARPTAASPAKKSNGSLRTVLSRETKLAIDAGEAVCREVACEGLATTGGYCRLHYIKNWKKIKRKELILREKKLNHYIEELVLKYPEKYIEAIRQDLSSEKDFGKVITDLDLDEGSDEFDVEGEGDEVLDTIKRGFEDEGEGF